ncbi:MAG: hydroxyacylglutathione hydrolase, partial [Pseudomonadales bacterium]|nr:hydroxyacylglutathione hydrolase [Pseudomonadales bacterium]
VTNPFLRCTNQQVIESAESFAGGALADEIATFAAIRAWKDEF